MVKIKSKTSIAKGLSNVEAKSIWKPLRTSLLLLSIALIIYVLSQAYFSIWSINTYYAGAVTVSGHGEVEVMPDVQRLSIIITPVRNLKKETATSTPAKPESSIEEISQSIKSFLISQGVVQSDILIKSPSNISVKLRMGNIQKADSIASALVQQKNNSGVDLSRVNISVTTENPEVESKEEGKVRALEAALENAKNNAAQVSQSMGVSLGKITSYSDQDNSNYNPSDYYGSTNDSLYSASAVSTNTDGSENRPIVFSYDVFVTYQVK